MEIQGINIVYANMEKMVAVPVTKRMEIITSIKVCLISQVNINYEENSEKKTFLANPKHQYHVPKCGEHDSSAHNKKNGDYYKYQSLSHFTYEH